MHDVANLQSLFNTLFAEQENTILVKGDDEPIYLPADKHCKQHRIVFAHGFFASALHEIAHWCIAGNERRQLQDYGYWYEAERDIEAQQQFAAVEAKPQALEWIFSQACQFRFVLSIDNLSAPRQAFSYFKNAVLEEVEHYQQQGLPKRAELWYNTLSAHFNCPKDYRQIDFSTMDVY